MSAAPQRLMQLLVPPGIEPAEPAARAPLAQVLQAPGADALVQPSFSLVSGQAPGSWVPDAAPCHSALVHRCLPAARHAYWAWNQVMFREGVFLDTEQA